MGTFWPLFIQLVSGAVGGNVAGSLLKNQSLGTVGNSIAGILGGGLGGQLLNLLGVATSGGAGLDLGTIISNILGGGVGGGVLMAVISVLKQLFAKKA